MQSYSVITILPVNSLQHFDEFQEILIVGTDSLGNFSGHMLLDASEVLSMQWSFSFSKRSKFDGLLSGLCG
jgi:hypothetical protein